MRKVIANEWMTLDEVVQAPSYADEDVTGGFGLGPCALKAEGGKDLHVIGSPGLVQTLMARGLVDELRLMIDPLVAGGGKRLFRDDGALRSLRLAGSQVTSTGAIIATYAAAGG